MADHFVALKNEQTARIVLRDTALYVYIGTIFAVYAAEGQAGDNAALIEIIRVCSTAVSAIMFSIYLSNDFYVSRIGSFVAEHAEAGKFSDWEKYHRAGFSYVLQKFFRTLVVVLLFGGWAGWQAAPIFLSGDRVAQIVAGVFGGVVIVELLLFLRLLGGPPRPRKRTQKHSKTAAGAAPAAA